MIDMLQDIAEAQGKLDAIDTQLCATIRIVETELASRISTRITVKIAGERVTAIGFGKLQGAWCLFVEYDAFENRLVDAPRDVRAQAFAGGHVRRLITESATLIRGHIAQRDAAIKEANDLLTQMGALEGLQP